MRKIQISFLLTIVLAVSMRAQMIRDTVFIAGEDHSVIRLKVEAGLESYDRPGNTGSSVGHVWISDSYLSQYYSFFNFYNPYLPVGSNIIEVKFHSKTYCDYMEYREMVVRNVITFPNATNQDWVNKYDQGASVVFLDYGESWENIVLEQGNVIFNWLTNTSPEYNSIKLGITLDFDYNNHPNLYYETDTTKLTTFEIMVVYDRPIQDVTYTIENSMGTYNGGIIGVGINEEPQIYNSPKTITTQENNLINLQAYTNQNPNGEYFVFNEINSPRPKSSWDCIYRGKSKELGNVSSVSFQSSIYYDQKITANLEPAWPITLNYLTEFGEEYVKLEYIAKGNTVDIIAPLSENINNREYHFAGWLDYFVNSNIITLTPSNNTTIIPRYKYPTHSNQITGYSSNSQRKIIRTNSDNYLHSVYESMGMVWYERSTDNGVTWKIMNNGSPLSQNNAKNPCLISNGEYMVIIAFQEQNGDEFKIRIQSFNYIDDIILANYSREIHKPYTDECHPAISRAAYNSFYKIMVAWEEKDGSQWWPAGGIYYIIGDLNYTGTQFSFSDGANLAINTDQTCSNPTLMGNNAYPAHFNLAYQQNITNSSSKIWYHHIGIDNNGIPTDATRQEVSYGSGYTKNYNPSIIEINNGARVVWVGERESAGIDRPTTVEGTGVSVLNKTSTTTEKSVVFKSPSYYRFWYFGNNVQGPTITRSNDNLAYVIAWNETNNNSNKFVDNNLTTIKNFNLAGNYVQVANGATKQDMIGMVFDSRTAPYSFTKTNNIGSYYPKLMPGIVGINYGRQGLVKKDSSQIYFRIGDIWNNGESVNFLQVPEEYITNGLESLNNILISEPFEISDGESFIYSVQYGLVESGASKLGANNYINFKVKLIEANTGETLRIFDNVTYSDTDYEQYNNLLYQVNVNGIGNKEVKLCLEIVSNSVAEYFVADKVSDEDVMAKANIKQVELTQEIEINSYDLYQNYPNPFNPTTNITYQIPKDGHVSLKIYDVLGKEIITLVEEQKTRGKYTVTFDGSNLASGVYIYRLETGNFVSTKKLMLMK